MTKSRSKQNKDALLKQTKKGKIKEIQLKDTLTVILSLLNLETVFEITNLILS
jgi:hypothetical protein